MFERDYGGGYRAVRRQDYAGAWFWPARTSLFAKRFNTRWMSY